MEEGGLDTNGNAKKDLSKHDSIKKMKETKREPLSLLHEWSTVTGWHGIADAYLARSACWRGMWIFIVLFTLVLGLNQTICLILDFAYQDSWTTSITSLKQKSLPVPTLVVCSLNIYNRTALSENNVTEDQVVKNAASNAANVPPDSFPGSFFGDQYRTSTPPNTRKPFGYPNSNFQNGRFGPGQGGFLPGQQGFGGPQGNNNGNEGDDQQKQQQQQPGFPNMQNGFQGGPMGPQQSVGMGGQQGRPMGGQQGPMGGGMGGGFGRGRRDAPKKGKGKTKKPKGTRAMDLGTTTPVPASDPQMDSIYSLMDNSTFQCVATVLSCGAGSALTWDSGDRSLLTDKCCTNSTQDEDYCYTVKLAPAFESMLDVDGQIGIASSESTVFLLMDPRLNEYMGRIVPNERAGQGFRFYFGDTNDAKYYSKPILIQPGTYNVIELTVEETKTTLSREAGITKFIMPPPKPPCRVKTNTSYAYIRSDEKNGTHQYAKWACEADCHIKVEIQGCNCTTLESNIYDKETFYCKNITERIECKRRMQFLKNQPKNSPYYACKEECDEACDWKSISSVVSTTTFPAPAKVKFLRTYLYQQGLNYSDEQIKNLSLVEVYYGSKVIRLTERSQRATVNELISNVGGALGVWAGISLITIYQLFVYLFMCTFDWIVAVRKRREDATPIV